MPDRTRVYFSMTYDDPNEEVGTRIVGRAPSRFRAKGTPLSHGKGAALRKVSHWTLESDCAEEIDFEVQLDALLATLERVAEGVRHAARMFGAQIVCYAWRETVNPGFHLRPDHITRAAALELAFDFDIYAIPPDEEDIASR